MSRACFFSLLIFMSAWLLNDHYRPWMSFHSEMLAFAGLWGLFASILWGLRGNVLLPLLIIKIAFVVGLPWLQYVTGISFFAGDALLSSLYLSALLTAIFVGYTFGSAGAAYLEHGLVGLMHCLWIAALVSAAIGLAQWLNVQGVLGVYVIQTDLGDRAMGNLGQPNQLATLLLMGMTAFCYVFERQIIGRLAFVLGIGFMSWVLILTQSRAGMLSVLVIASFFLWKKRSIKSRLPSKAVVWWAFCFFLGTFALPYLSEFLQLGDVRSIHAAEPINQRWRMWQQVVYAVAQSPWVGYGWNQTPTAHAVGAVAFPGEVTYTNAHNFVMDILAWSGLPLGLLLTGIITYWFLTRIRTSIHLNAVHAMACLLPIAVHSMLEYPFSYAYFLITAGFMVGVVEAVEVRRKILKLSIRWVWAFFSFWFCVGSYLTYEYFLIESDFRVVRFHNLSIGHMPEAYEESNVWMMSHMAAMLKAARQVVEPGMSKADLENLRQVSERFAYGSVRFRYALALALNGDPLEASHQMSIIQGMYGNALYVANKTELRRLQKEQYPQLAAVITP